MKKKEVIYLLYLFSLSIALINALTLVAFGSSETSMGNMSTSGYEKSIDPENMNVSVKPGDDFYKYANGGWIKSHPVPADKEKYDNFDIARDRTVDRIKGIIESAVNNTSAPEGSLEQKIGEFYRVRMDNVTRDKQRLDPIKGELMQIDKISNISDVQAVSTHMMDYGMSPFFSINAELDYIDDKNRKVMIATFTQRGLGLSDRDAYLRQDNFSNMVRGEYMAHIARMFVYLGDSPKVAEDNAKTVMRIETRLSNASFNKVDNNDKVKTYNKMSLEELQVFAPSINWSLMFSTLGRPDITEVNVRNPSFFKELSTALQDESVADWKTFLRWKLISAMSPYLSSDLEKEHFNFYGRAENNALGEAIGCFYVDKYFDPNSKARIQEEMVPNLKKTYKERIQNITWMEPQTKKKVFMKLDSLEIQVGYPDKWLNFSELEVKNDSYVNNTLRAKHFHFHHGTYGLDRIGIGRNLWVMNPLHIRAYVDYSENSIVFPAGILQPPFFNKDADDAVIYGSIGFIIGHEMIHYFDSQGWKYNETVNLTDRWTKKDEDNFNQSTAVLVDEYNNFQVFPHIYINGSLTLRENIADLGGLIVAYHAYKLSLKGEPEMIDGFTGDQRFFLSFAQVWRESDNDEYLWSQVHIDTHSPSKFRVNGVVFNIPEFYNAFPNVKPGDKLYRPENERPVIW